MENNRAQWGSKIGFILAAAGSAVGLGNIWKFPGKAFEGRGGAYILIYLAIVVLIGFPVMLSELTIGRAAQANAIDSFHKLGYRGFKWVGVTGVAVAFIVTSYYCHVGGWVLRYVVSYITEAQTVYADPLGYLRPARLQRRDGRDMVPADRHSLCRGLYGSQRLHHHQGR